MSAPQLRMFCHLLTFTYVIAADMNDAVRALCASIGTDEESFARDVWQEVPGDKPIRVREDGTDGVETKTAAEWITENGRGVLCSSELYLWAASVATIRT